MTAHTLYGNLDPVASLDWSLGINEYKLIVGQIVPFAVYGLLYFFVSECVHLVEALMIACSIPDRFAFDSWMDQNLIPTRKDW